MEKVIRDKLAGTQEIVRTPESQTDEAAAMGFLVRVAEDLNSTPELDAVLRKVAERVKEQVEYDTFSILLLDDLGRELYFRFTLGFPDDVAEHWRFGLGQGLVGTVAKTGQPLRVGEVKTDSRYIKAAEDVCSEMAIPLTVKNRTIGVLDVGSRQCHYFTESHQRLLTLLAGRLANTIENARLYENLREQARTLSLLQEVSRKLSSILDREELLGRVAELVKRLIDYQLFSVMLWNEESQLLEHTFTLRHDERVHQEGGIPLGHGICGAAAALRQPLRIPNVDLDPRYVRCSYEIEVRSELVVPLVFKDRLVGVLDLESTEYNAFTEQHEQMLSTLASNIAIALENARLYEAVRRDEQRLERDLATAREIQKGLLPDAPPRVPGLDIAFAYEPARQLGGDIYDFLPYGEGRIAIVVGDVAGKATPAALYGSLAVGIVRGHVVQHPCEPAEMLEQVNEHLRQPRIDNRYIALVFAVYDSPSRTLTVANAGFPYPWLVRGDKAKRIPVAGVPLGLLPESRYEQEKIVLQPGDVVIFCSDGIHEAMDREQQQLGLGRLEEIIAGLVQGSSPRAIADGLMRATDRYAARNSKLADDRTVVVLQVTE